MYVFGKVDEKEKRKKKERSCLSWIFNFVIFKGFWLVIYFRIFFNKSVFFDMIFFWDRF